MNINFSNIPDNNIFHIFAFDILKYYYPFCNKSFIFSKNIDIIIPVKNGDFLL